MRGTAALLLTNKLVAMLKAEARRRTQWEAFAMGQQEWLGAGSRVRWLGVGVVRMVLEYRDTSLKRNRNPLGTYLRPMPRVLRGS